MQKRVHDYVVADKGTSKEALDLLVKDWDKVFKEEGKKLDHRRLATLVSPCGASGDGGTLPGSEAFR